MMVLIAGPHKPPRSYQGLGLPYLARVLEEAGFEVRICDPYPPSPDTHEEAILDERLAAEIARMNPSLVGITIHTPSLVERARLAKDLRKRLPHTLLVAGGHHPSAEPEHLLHHLDFDVCVIGEGEETLLEIAPRMAEGEGRERTGWLAKIRGGCTSTTASSPGPHRARRWPRWMPCPSRPITSSGWRITRRIRCLRSGASVS